MFAFDTERRVGPRIK